MSSAADVRPHPAPGFTGPLLVWLVMQMLALLLAVARVPLAARYPQPAELLAAQVMVVVQLTGAALLMPYLLRNWTAAVAVIATAWPFLVLSGVLSGVPTLRWVAVAAYVSAWLIALALVNLALQDASRLWAAAAALVGTVGGLVLFYLRVEFRGSDGNWLALLPPFAALRRVDDKSSILDWIMPAALATLSACALTLRRRIGHVIHKP